MPGFDLNSVLSDKTFRGCTLALHDLEVFTVIFIFVRI